MSMFLGNKVDRQHIQAVNNCKLRDDKLVELFERCLEDVKNQLTKADDVVRLHRLQGQASVLEDFIEAVDKAAEILERRKS